MDKSAIQRLRSEVEEWVAAYNAAQPYRADAAQIMLALENRIGADRLAHIGAAFTNGWLVTETEAGRGYFVRESDRDGRQGGQFTIIHQGAGKVAPCWELFVQLADYGWLRTIAARHGQLVRLEDHLMDLTVRCGDKLLLYLEQKMHGSTGDRLIEKMRAYGDRGIDFAEPDKGNDPLRKSKYLVRPGAHPLYFGVSAVDYRKLFRVEYSEGNRFSLLEDGRPFSAPLAEHSCSETAGSGRSPVDPLAIEVERLCPEIWVSLGSGQTAYNFYAPGAPGDAVLLGLYESGEVWTDVKGLGATRAAALAAALDAIGITLATGKDWSFWRKGAAKVDIADVPPELIAQALRSAVD